MGLYGYNSGDHVHVFLRKFKKCPLPCTHSCEEPNIRLSVSMYHLSNAKRQL